MITLSLAEVFAIRNRAFAAISEHSFAIDALAASIANMDHALQVCIAERNLDEQQSLVTAARRLSDALVGGEA